MPAKITKIAAFGGLDENARGNGAYASSCSGFAINESGALTKGQGYEEFLNAGAGITGLWSGGLGSRRLLIYVAGPRLYAYDFDDHSHLQVGYVNGGKTVMFTFGGVLYILNNTGYYKYDGNTFSTVEGYIPLIAVSTTPDGAGTQYENANILTPKRRQRFSGDGTSKSYKLAESDIAFVSAVTIGGEAIPAGDYTVDAAVGSLMFSTAPPSGLNNVEITYAVPTSVRIDVLGCEGAMLFGSNADERVFLWGNPANPCHRYHSELADGVPSAEYFPVTGYTVIGNTAITDIVQQYDRQLIFTQNSAFYSYCEIKTSQTGQAYASFPVYPLNPVKGNYLTGSACTVNGMPVTLCDDGLNIWESTEVESQKNAVCFSDAIKSLILSYAQAGNTTIKLFSDIQSGRLIVSMTRLMYIYDTRRRCWYKLEGITALRFCSGFGRMYIAANDGKIYRLSDTIKDFDAFYTTHYSDFGSCGLKNIKDITLTLKAGEATAGSITAVWTNGGRKQSRSVCFSVSEAINGSVVKVRIPLYIPLADGLTFTFACPSGKDLTLLGYEVATTEKGELPYGL